MTERNAEFRHDYQEYLELAGGQKLSTVVKAMGHIGEFEDFIEGAAFQKIKIRQIKDFKEHIYHRPSMKTKSELASSTICHILSALKAFYTWLINQDGCRRMSRTLPDYFTPSNEQRKKALVTSDSFIPTPDDLRKVVEAMPTKTFIQRRDQFSIAFMYLTGVRDGAFIGIRLKHLDINQWMLNQDPREISTKNDKWIRASWFPVDEYFVKIVTNFVQELRDMGAVDDTPIFPSGIKRFGRNLECIKFEFCSSTEPVRKIFKKATALAGIEYFKPHSIRTTLGNQFGTWAKNLEEFAALSACLGHENMATTLKNYVKPDPAKLGDTMNRIRERQTRGVSDEFQLRFERAKPDLQDMVLHMLAMHSSD